MHIFRLSSIIALCAVATGCANIALTSQVQKSVSLLSVGEWSGHVKRAHPHAPPGYYDEFDKYLVVQNCDSVVKTFFRLDDGTYVQDRPYETRPYGPVTFLFSLAQSQHEKGWREIRALVLYELPERSLAVSVMRSVATPIAEPDSQIIESFDNGVLTYSSQCSSLPMAEQQPV